MNKNILNEVGEIRKLMGLLNEQSTPLGNTDIPDWIQSYFDLSDISFKDVTVDEFQILKHLKDHRCTSVAECYQEVINLPTDGLDENLKKRLDLLALKLGKLRVSKYKLSDL